VMTTFSKHYANIQHSDVNLQPPQCQTNLSCLRGKLNPTLFDIREDSQVRPVELY
jgi:hypothetical protein